MTAERVIICTFDAPGFTGGPNTWLRRWYDVVTAHGFEVLTLAFVLEPDRYRLPEDYPLLAALADRGPVSRPSPTGKPSRKKSGGCCPASRRSGRRSSSPTSL
jgi:hypothetical protein